MSTTNENKFWISLLLICCPFLCVRNRNGRELEYDLDIWAYCSFYQLLNYYHFTEITSEREACVFKSKDSKWITFAKMISNFSKWWGYKYSVPRIYITLSFFFSTVTCWTENTRGNVYNAWNAFCFTRDQEKEKGKKNPNQLVTGGWGEKSGGWGWDGATVKYLN